MDKTEINKRIHSYPTQAQTALFELIVEIESLVKEHKLKELNYSLKWGEPSAAVAGGSPFRFDWKEKSPDTIRLYFHCQTKLVETFREIYSDEFQFEGNRAMVLPLEKNWDREVLRHCLLIALTYKKRKHLPLLGAFQTDHPL